MDNITTGGVNAPAPVCAYCGQPGDLMRCCGRHPDVLVCADVAGCRDRLLAVLRAQQAAEGGAK